MASTPSTQRETVTRLRIRRAVPVLLVRATALAAGVLFSGAGGVAHAGPRLDLRIEVHTLANGLHVVLAPDPALPDVGLALQVHAGSADDPDGLEGLAHLAEHVSFKGSRDVGEHDYFRLLDQVGATSVNGTTAFDSTTFTEALPPEGLARALWLEANRLGHLAPYVQDAAVEHERAILEHEFRLRSIDNTSANIREITRDELFGPGHPYRSPEDGLASIDRIRPADVRAFVRTWYGPGNATLALAGHFDPAQAMSLVEKYFGDLVSDDVPVRPALPPPPPPGDLWLEVVARLMHGYAAMSWLAPPWQSRDDRALDIAALLLTRSLSRALVEESGQASNVVAFERSWSRASLFTVSVSPSGKTDVADALLAVQRHMARFDTLLTNAEVEAAKAWLAQRRLLALEGALSRATQLASRDSFGLDDYDTIDAAAVRDAVRRTLGRAGRVTVVVRNDDPILPFMPAEFTGVVTHRDRQLP
jgi:zinc protease